MELPVAYEMESRELIYRYVASSTEVYAKMLVMESSCEQWCRGDTEIE